MTNLKGNMLIAHGGGPTPVINNSLRGAIEQALQQDEIGTIYGARFGVEGILAGDLINLSALPESQINLLSVTPASALGSCRRKLTSDDYPLILNCFKRFNIRYFFYNGGNDSMDTCAKIHKLADQEGYEIRIVGIPKTIDNDLANTDHSPGYGSAAKFIAVSAAELALDAASLPIHVVIMEVMGRNAGWLTAATALYRQAMPCEHLIYLPENPFDRDGFLKTVKQRFDRRRGLLITVSEGVRDIEGKPLGDTGIRDGFGHVIAGGAAQYLADLIIQHTGIPARSEKPGLLGRVSMALRSEVDLREAYEAGAFAVLSAIRGESGKMVSIVAERQPKYNSVMTLVPLESVANTEKTFPNEWINTLEADVSRQFIDYCAPLVDTPFPTYARL